MDENRLKTLAEELESGKAVKFNELLKICKELFGEPRHSGTSHHVFKVPWPGDPRINLQPDGKYAKKYQVRQVLKAIEKLEAYLKESSDEK